MFTVVQQQQPMIPTAITVVDPLSRKLQIPLDSVKETRALKRFGIPSLCMLYLTGRCRQGVNCHQVHADPNVVANLRRIAQQMPTCCPEHGDVNDTLRDPAWRSLQLQVQGVNVPLERVGYTAGLRRLIQESSGLSTIIIHPNSVCRLHAGDRCRYSEDCKFIHVCRDIITQQLSQWVTPLVPDLELKHQARTSGGMPVPPQGAPLPSQNAPFFPTAPTVPQGGSGYQLMQPICCGTDSATGMYIYYLVPAQQQQPQPDAATPTMTPPPAQTTPASVLSSPAIHHSKDAAVPLLALPNSSGTSEEALSDVTSGSGEQPHERLDDFIAVGTTRARQDDEEAYASLRLSFDLPHGESAMLPKALLEDLY